MNILLPNFIDLYKRPVLLLALGFGSGLSPKAPGTVGTLVALPFFFLFNDLPLWAYLAVLVVTFALGVVLCQKAADALGVYDHPAIVWDEFVGMWLSLLPLVIWGGSILWLIMGFILFRGFDILKPWPISWLDKHVHGGLGIMLDDLLAGVAAAVLLALLMRFVGV